MQVKLTRYQIRILKKLNLPKRPSEIKDELNLKFWQAGRLLFQLWKLEDLGYVEAFGVKSSWPWNHQGTFRAYCITPKGRKALKQSQPT